MVKSQLIKDITTNNISLEESLQRLLIITNDLNNESLKNWILSELNGYIDDKELPKYRRQIGCRLLYTGINGHFRVANVPLPNSYIPEDYRDIITSSNSNESIRVIERIVNNNETVGYDITNLASIIYEHTGVQCLSITKQLNVISFEEILSNIKNKIIVILLDLEKKFGNLDTLDIDVRSISHEETKELNHQINSVFYDGKSEVISYD